MPPLSTLRLSLLRVLYLLNFALLGLDVWPALFQNAGAWDPVKGVAYSFWGALSALSALGLRYPVKMLPLLLMQLTYKIIWLIAVALPQWTVVRSTGLASAMTMGLVLDLLLLPWPFILAQFVRAQGDRWRPMPDRMP